MGGNMKAKKILNMLYFIIVYQLIRIALKNVIFLLVQPGIIANILINTGIIIITLLLLIFYMRNNLNKGESENLFKCFLIGLGIIFALNFASLFITRSFNTENYLNLIFNILLIPIFDEFVFRGYLWERINKRSDNLYFNVLILALLEGVWQLGFIDNIIINDIYTKTAFAPTINFWQLLIGIGYGVIMGLTKIKFKNNKVCILVHAICNTLLR